MTTFRSLVFHLPRCFVIPIRHNHKDHFKSWRNPFALDDDQNLIGQGPEIREEWLNESISSDKVTVDIGRIPKRIKSKMTHCKEFLEIDSHEDTSFVYQRKAFGNFGKISKIDPSVCWPTKEEISLQKEKEQLFEPCVESMLNTVKQEKKEYNKFIQERMAAIDTNLEKMPRAIEQYKQREKKQEEAAKMQAKKRLQRMEEARDFFGYAVAPNDPLFIRRKDALEEEDKKKKKMEKKKKNEALRKRMS